MPSFVDQSEKIDRVTLSLVIKVKWEGLRPAAGKSMRTNVIAPLPTNDLSHLPSDTFPERAGQSLGNLLISAFFSLQVVAKLAAENRLHSGLPKTSSNFRPESLPETRSFNR